jgi:hypothetical protein
MTDAARFGGNVAGPELDAATKRMQRRLRAIHAAKEQFRDLPENSRALLEYEYELANDEARRFLRQK